jgi:hypothetical protein
MAETKTKATKISFTSFLADVDGDERRKDCKALAKLMKQVTGEPPVMWGPSIVGFGSYHYKYDSGHEGDSCVVGFSPRKSDLTLYLLSTIPGREALLKKLGKHKSGRACVYIKRLADVDLDVLEELIRRSVKTRLSS